MTDESTIEAPERARRKVREGTVRSNKMDKTVVVEVVRRSSHPQYNKTVATQSPLCRSRRGKHAS